MSMKRTKQLIFLLCVLSSLGLNAQQSNAVKGSKFLTLKLGVSKHSTPGYLEIQYGFLFRDQLGLRSGVFYEKGSLGSTDFNIGGINTDIIYTPFSISDIAFFNFGLGLYGGYEAIQSNRDENLDQRTFILGARGLIGVDFSIGKKWSIGLEFNQWYDQFSKLGKLHYTGTLNLNYILN